MAIRTEDKLSALAKAARALNGAGVVWALGASAALYFYGITDEFHDFDIIVDEADADRAIQALLSVGEGGEGSKSERYVTRVFCEFIVDQADFDIMAGYAIRVGEDVYSYRFRRDAARAVHNIGDIPVPLSAPEDWYVLYQLMGGREEKAQKIEAYLRARGFDKQRLEEMIKPAAVPPSVSARVRALIQAM